MQNEENHEITALLVAWSKGDAAALEELIPLVTAELRRLAQHYLRGERPGHTLQPTALIHELYLRLLGKRAHSFRNRAHFFGFAAASMRHILVDHARARLAERRGGKAVHVALDEGLDLPLSPRSQVLNQIELLALDQALTQLGQLDERQSQIVELRAFGGLGMREIAQVLELSEATVYRDWAMARAWLHDRLRPGTTGGVQ